MKKPALAFFILSMSTKLALGDSTNNLGIFSDQADIGSVAKAGSVNFDPANGEYLIAGGGENMWFTNDAFHFAWKEMSGDFRLTADVRWIGTNGNPHRKACLLVRQSLKPGSVYADVALHGNGLTSLQYRDTPDGTTHGCHYLSLRPTWVHGKMFTRARLEPALFRRSFESLSNLGADARSQARQFVLHHKWAF